MLIGAGLRSGTRLKQNWHAAGWLALADSLPASWRLVLLDSAPQPPLGPHEVTEADRQFLGPDLDESAFYRHPRVLDRTGTPSMHHAAALIARCAAFVGVDSGLLHVAHALGKPTVVLCAAAPAAARTPLCGANAAFEGRLPCFPCEYRTACPADKHCLDWISGVEVVAQLRRLVGG